MSSSHELPHGLHEVARITIPCTQSGREARFARLFRFGRMIYAACRTGVMELDSETLESRWVETPGCRPISVGVSPDGQLLYIGAYPNHLEIRRREDLSLIRTVADGHRSELNSVAPSPDGALLATSSLGQVMLSDAQGRTLETHPAAGYSLQWSPDGRWLAAGGTGRITIFDRDLQALRIINRHRSDVLAIDFVPNSQTFVTLGKDGSMSMSRRPRNRPIWSHGHHAGQALAMAVSPDLIVTKGRDNRVRFCATSDGAEIASYFEQSTSSGWCVGSVFAEGHQRLFVPGSRESILRVFDVDAQALRRGPAAVLLDLADLAQSPSGLPGDQEKSAEEPLVSLLFEDRVKALETEDAPSSQALDDLARSWVRLSLHGFRLPRAHALVAGRPSIQTELKALQQRGAQPRFRRHDQFENLMTDDVSDEELARRLEEPRRARSWLNALQHRDVNLSCDRLREAVLRLLRYGDETSGQQAATIVMNNADPQRHRQIAEDLARSLEESSDEVPVWRALRSLKRLPGVFDDRIFLLIDRLLAEAPQPLRTEIFDTLSALASHGLLTVDYLLLGIAHKGRGSRRLAVGLRHHPEFRTPRVREVLEAWLRFEGERLQRIAAWLLCQFDQEQESSIIPGRDLFPNEDVLDVEYLRSRSHQDLEELPRDFIQRVLRLCWLPLMSTSEAPEIARRMVEKWLASGVRSHMNLCATEPESQVAPDSPDGISCEESTRSTFLSLAGLNEGAWRSAVLKRLASSTKERRVHETVAWARLVLDHDLLGNRPSHVSDATIALAMLRAGHANADRHIARYERQGSKLIADHERELHSQVMQRFRELANPPAAG